MQSLSCCIAVHAPRCSVVSAAGSWLLAHGGYLLSADTSTETVTLIAAQFYSTWRPGLQAFYSMLHGLCPHLRHGSQLSALAQEAICTAGKLFLAAHKGYQRQALLPARARNEGMSAGEMLFDKLPGAGSAADEADAWQVCCHWSRECMSAL